MGLWLHNKKITFYIYLLMRYIDTDDVMKIRFVMSLLVCRD